MTRARPVTLHRSDTFRPETTQLLEVAGSGPGALAERRLLAPVHAYVQCRVDADMLAQLG